MMISVSATGFYKSYIPIKTIIEIDSETTLEDLKGVFKIPSSIICCYVINHKICQSDTRIHEGDHVKFQMVVGGG